MTKTFHRGCQNSEKIQQPGNDIRGGHQYPTTTSPRMRDHKGGYVCRRLLCQRRFFRRATVSPLIRTAAVKSFGQTIATALSEAKLLFLSLRHLNKMPRSAGAGRG